MHERDEILAMLLVSGFFGTSFWPVLCGWVDLGTVAGWLELCANFGTVLLVIGVFGSIGAVGFIAACLARWCIHAARSRPSFALSILPTSFVRCLFIVAWWVAFYATRLIGWGAMPLRRRRPIPQ